MLRHDISEGAHFNEMPRIGFGRIRSHPLLNEWYATVSAFGKRLFVAAGKYDGNRRRFRYWVKK